MIDRREWIIKGGMQKADPISATLHQVAIADGPVPEINEHIRVIPKVGLIDWGTVLYGLERLARDLTIDDDVRLKSRKTQTAIKQMLSREF